MTTNTQGTDTAHATPPERELNVEAFGDGVEVYGAFQAFLRGTPVVLRYGLCERRDSELPQWKLAVELTFEFKPELRQGGAWCCHFSQVEGCDEPELSVSAGHSGYTPRVIIYLPMAIPEWQRVRLEVCEPQADGKTTVSIFETQSDGKTTRQVFERD